MMSMFVRVCVVVLSLTLCAAGQACGSEKPALLLIAHGSRSKAWCDTVTALESEVKTVLTERTECPFACVRVAFLEAAQPSIRTAVDECAEAGIRRIYAIPLFTCESDHLIYDVPAALNLYRNPHTAHGEGIEQVTRSDVHVTLGPPLCEGGLLGEIMLERVKEISKEPSSEAVVLLAHGSDRFDSVWRSVCNEIGQQIQTKSEIDRFDYAFVAVGQEFAERGVPVIQKALADRPRVLVVGLYLSLSVKRHMAGKLPESLQQNGIVFSDRGLLPDPRVTQWIADTALSMASAERR
jgi:sirohydrochlorin ferrochelatase